MEGEILANGERYDSIMPAHSFLTDAQLAPLLSYIRQAFGNSASAVSESEVAAMR
ncbi:hypothetical protein SAMN04488057_11330 [Cyclobacterium lianum]|uniref:Uncharacterized protein n=1 Tax=Cyclobacterium lianum TaxID=388280 RepID=A0A1M7Q209_9BACT|nr:hypothetical protein [Cyclobacterium lianum]SHN24143.1 hypothetical protein SAMN04488057_11330 [Cyclobacterium lianum]